jgi:hypothetical protein
MAISAGFYWWLQRPLAQSGAVRAKTRSEKNEELKKLRKLDTGDMVSYDSYHRGDGARSRTRVSTWSVNLSRASVYCSSADFNVSFA